MLLTEVVQKPQCLARKVTNLWVIPLFLELIDYHNRKNNFVFSKPKKCSWVREQDRGVKDESSDCCLLLSFTHRLRSLFDLRFPWAGGFAHLISLGVDLEENLRLQKLRIAI
jgi:hypothetical protein